MLRLRRDCREGGWISWTAALEDYKPFHMNAERPLLCRGAKIKVWMFFFYDLFSVRAEYGLVSMGGACYRLSQAFSIPVYSPRDKRGRSCSRNRGVGF